MTAYCLRCKTHTEMTRTRVSTTKNNRASIKGDCVRCGGSMHRIASTRDAEALK